MNLEYDVRDKKRIKMLRFSKRFKKYPDCFLSNCCRVKVNSDDYLVKDEFTIYCKDKILPRRIYIYGKKRKRGIRDDDDKLFLNYWMEVFLRTIESGKLYMQKFEKTTSKTELSIGIPFELRYRAFKNRNWTRDNIIEFISCLFDMPVEQTQYEQQDLFEEFLAA